MVDLLAVLGFSLLWALFFGELSLYNLTIGALLGLVLLSVVQRDQERAFPKRLWAGGSFCLPVFPRAVQGRSRHR